MISPLQQQIGYSDDQVRNRSFLESDLSYRRSMLSAAEAQPGDQGEDILRTDIFALERHLGVGITPAVIEVPRHLAGQASDVFGVTVTSPAVAVGGASTGGGGGGGLGGFIGNVSQGQPQALGGLGLALAALALFLLWRA